MWRNENLFRNNFQKADSYIKILLIYLAVSARDSERNECKKGVLRRDFQKKKKAICDCRHLWKAWLLASCYVLFTHSWVGNSSWFAKWILVRGGLKASFIQIKASWNYQVCSHLLHFKEQRRNAAAVGIQFNPCWQQLYFWKFQAHHFYSPCSKQICKPPSLADRFIPLGCGGRKPAKSFSLGSDTLSTWISLSSLMTAVCSRPVHCD